MIAGRLPLKEEEKKVSVKTYLVKRASLAQGPGLGSPPLCRGPHPMPGREQSGAGSRQSRGMSVWGCAVLCEGTGNGGAAGQPGSATACRCFLELSILPAAMVEEKQGLSKKLASLELLPLLPAHCLFCLQHLIWSRPSWSCPAARP